MSSNSKITPEQAKENFLKKASSFKYAFGSPDGKVVMEHLMEMFYDRTSIVPGDPYATHAREGAREVMIYINELIKLGGRNEIS